MATKKLVPRATNEGGLGTALKVWGPSWLQNLTITNLQTSTSDSVLVETSGNVEKRDASTFVPNLESLDEGVSLTTTTESINYVGAGVTATTSGNDTTVTINGTCVLDTEDDTSFVGLWESKTGCQDPKTDGGLRYDALLNILKVGAESSNNRVWIMSNRINKFLGNLEVKSQNSHLMLWGNGGKIGFKGFAGSMIATMYTNYGLRLHHLNTESAPTYVLTEGIATGATTTPYSVSGPGFVTKTPITSIIPNLQTLDEGVSLTTTTQSFDFVGSGVTATNVGNAVTVTISGGGPVADTEDSTCFVGLWESATGVLDPKTDEGLLYDALNDHLKVHGRLTVGADDTNTAKIIERGHTSLNQAGGALGIYAGGVSAGAGNNLGGGMLSLWAGQGTGAASAGGSDSIIGFYTFKDVAAGSLGQTAQMSHTFFADSQNRFRMAGQDAATNFFTVSINANAETTIETMDSAATNGHLWLKPDGDLYIESATNKTYHGKVAGDSYFIQRSNAANLPAGNFWLQGGDAVGNYTGAGTATGGHVNYAAGAGTGTGPNGQHIWWLSEIFAAGNLGVAQPLRMAMTLATDNDENALLSLSAVDGNMSLFMHCGQDRARIYTPTIGKTIEIGAKTADGSLIKFQDHTTTTYGDTLATVHSLRTESFLLACSDETSLLTTGTAKTTFRMPYAFTLTEVRASVNTAPTGAILTVDINEGGATVLTTKLTIDIGELTSTTAATAAVIGGAGPALADDAEITIDIDQIGSTVAGKGLKVTLIGHKTV
jgi:hypothetical protein